MKSNHLICRTMSRSDVLYTTYPLYWSSNIAVPPIPAEASLCSIINDGFSGSLSKVWTAPWTVSSALQDIFPVVVWATHVYIPASSGLTCWNTKASESSSSPNNTLKRSSGSNSIPFRFHSKVGCSPAGKIFPLLSPNIFLSSQTVTIASHLSMPYLFLAVQE